MAVLRWWAVGEMSLSAIALAALAYYVHPAFLAPSVLALLWAGAFWILTSE